MKIQEIIEAIKIGFDKPKLYKRSVWNKTVKVMEFLSDNTNGEIVRTNLGSGLEKYRAEVVVNDEQLAIWALTYKRSLGSPILVGEAVPELKGIARELGAEVSDGVVIEEYFNRHPEEKSNK